MGDCKFQQKIFKHHFIIIDVGCYYLLIINFIKKKKKNGAIN